MSWPSIGLKAAPSGRTWLGVGVGVGLGLGVGVGVGEGVSVVWRTAETSTSRAFISA